MESIIIRRFAVSRLHLPDGTVLRNQIVEETSQGNILYRPLLSEEPMTEWRGGDFFLPSSDLNVDKS